ncbi:MAG TPA: class II aldolase/adducin family protein [Anaerovoracaceae bacterium]|nr:class II aldolase/adducin family protein [Anaerovoracaceae bacterium]
MNIQIAIENLIKYGKRIGLERYEPIGFMAVKLHEGAYLLTKSGMNLSEMAENDINGLNMDEGKIGRLLKSRTEINAIIFIRSNNAIELSKVKDSIKPSLDDLAQIIGVDAKVAKSFDDDDINYALKNRNGCYIKNEGLFAMGRSLEEAFAATRILEKSAYVELMSDKVGEIKPIKKFDCSRMNKFYRTSYSQVNRESDFETVTFDEKEKALREDIVECGVKMADEGLVQGTWGNISIRLDDKSILVTPSGMDYHSLGVNDIVRLNIDTMDCGKQRKPTCECDLHSKVLKNKANCKAVIHTHSYECSVFAATGKSLKLEGEIERIVGGDVDVISHAMPGTNKLAKLVSKAMSQKNACIMANHGLVCAGANLYETLDMCRELEKEAKKNIESRI